MLMFGFLHVGMRNVSRIKMKTKNVNSVTDHEHVRFVYFCTEDLFKIFLLVRLFPNNFKQFFQYKKRRKKEIVCG